MKNNLKDIYTRSPGEIQYNENILEHSNVLESYIQKIKVLLNTTPGEVIGFPNFGVGLDALIFELNVNEDEIKSRIYSQITEHCIESQYFETDVILTFFNGTTRDILLIDISINGTKEFGILIK